MKQVLVQVLVMGVSGLVKGFLAHLCLLQESQSGKEVGEFMTQYVYAMARKYSIEASI